MVDGLRVPIIRRLDDGTITDGTALWTPTPDGFHVRDFRDLDGEPLGLPPGASFEFESL